MLSFLSKFFLRVSRISMHPNIWPLVIELGDFKLTSATPLNELGWFLLGLLLLAGSSVAVLRWHRRARPDPFL
jgi:hypothetical protein